MSQQAMLSMEFIVDSPIVGCEPTFIQSSVRYVRRLLHASFSSIQGNKQNTFLMQMSPYWEQSGLILRTEPFDIENKTILYSELDRLILSFEPFDIKI